MRLSSWSSWLSLWGDTPKQAFRDINSDIITQICPSLQNQPLILFLQTTKTTILMGFLVVTHWTTWLHQEFQYCDKMSAIICQAKTSIRSQDHLEEWRKTGFLPKHFHAPLSPPLLLVRWVLHQPEGCRGHNAHCSSSKLFIPCSFLQPQRTNY